MSSSQTTGLRLKKGQSGTHNWKSQAPYVKLKVKQKEHILLTTVAITAPINQPYTVFPKFSVRYPYIHATTYNITDYTST